MTKYDEFVELVKIGSRDLDTIVAMQALYEAFKTDPDCLPENLNALEIASDWIFRHIHHEDKPTWLRYRDEYYESIVK